MKRGRLYISRDDDTAVVVAVTTPDAVEQIIEIRMTPKDFIDVLTKLRKHVECSYREGCCD